MQTSTRFAQLWPRSDFRGRFVTNPRGRELLPRKHRKLHLDLAHASNWLQASPPRAASRCSRTSFRCCGCWRTPLPLRGIASRVARSVACFFEARSVARIPPSPPPLRDAPTRRATRADLPLIGATRQWGRCPGVSLCRVAGPASVSLSLRTSVSLPKLI